MAAAAAYYEKAAIVDFPCVVEGMRHMFSLIPLGSDIFDAEFLRSPKKVAPEPILGGKSIPHPLAVIVPMRQPAPTQDIFEETALYLLSMLKYFFYCLLWSLALLIPVAAFITIPAIVSTMENLVELSLFSLGYTGRLVS